MVFRADQPDNGAGGNDRGGDIREIFTVQDGDDQASGLAQQTFYQADAWLVITLHLLELRGVEGEQVGFKTGDSKGADPIYDY